MSLIISLLIAVLVFALVIYIMNLFPIDARIKQIVWILLFILFVMWLVGNFVHPGVWRTP